MLSTAPASYRGARREVSPHPKNPPKIAPIRIQCHPTRTLRRTCVAEKSSVKDMNHFPKQPISIFDPQHESDLTQCFKTFHLTDEPGPAESPGRRRLTNFACSRIETMSFISIDDRGPSRVPEMSNLVDAPKDPQEGSHLKNTLLFEHLPGDAGNIFLGREMLSTNVVT